jgi:Domain of unknown function (DUF4352)
MASEILSSPDRRKSSFRTKPLNYVLIAVLVIGGFSQLRNFTEKKINSPFVANLVLNTPPSCSASDNSQMYYCIISIQITNTSTVPQTLNGTIFAIAEGKTYQASTDLGADSIDHYLDTFNPQESKSSVLDFKIPKGATIQTIFVSPTGAPTKEGASFVLPLKLVAQDNQTSPSGNLDQQSDVPSSNTDGSGILSRLNAIGDVKWKSETDSTVQAGADQVYNGQGCLVWVYSSESAMQDAINSGDFSKTLYWHGKDLVSGANVVLATQDKNNPCAQDIVSVLNWGPLA